MVDAVFDRVPTIPTRYVHVLAGAGDPTLEIKAGGPISAFVEVAGEATKTGSGSSRPEILSRHARYVAIDRTVPFLRYRYPIATHTCHSASPSFAKSQLYVERGCVDEHHRPKTRKDIDLGKRCVARCEGCSFRGPRSDPRIHSVVALALQPYSASS